jgi:hypothetical protein
MCSSRMRIGQGRIRRARIRAPRRDGGPLSTGLAVERAARCAWRLRHLDADRACLRELAHAAVRALAALNVLREDAV